MPWKIPFGDEKGKALSEASVSALEFTVRAVSQKLEENPNKPYADQDRKWLGFAKAELQKRGGSGQGGAAKPAAASAPPSASGALALRQADWLSGSYAEPQKLREALRRSSGEAHLVAPATECGSLPPGCDVAVSLVWINPDTSKEGPKDVYPVGGGDDEDLGQVGLAKASLDRIFSAAGISWDSEKSGRLDNGRDPNYCLFQVVGFIRNFDSSVREIFGTKEMDLREGSAQVEALFERYRAKLKKWEGHGKAKGWSQPKSPEAQIREMRLHILGHAETKARLRAGRTIGIKTSYSKAELQKPFAVARLMFTGHSTNPDLARLFAEKTADAMLSGMHGLYGRDLRQVPQMGAALPPAPSARVVASLGESPLGRLPAPPIGNGAEPLDDDDFDYDASMLGGEEGAQQSQQSQEGKSQPEASKESQTSQTAAENKVGASAAAAAAAAEGKAGAKDPPADGKQQKLTGLPATEDRGPGADRY